MSDRNLTISVCKGIGIILMVIGHSGCPRPIHDFIYLFHMPLFFIITGFLFKKKYLEEPLIFLKRKLETLYKPFFISKFIILAICIINDIITGTDLMHAGYLNNFLKILLFTGQYDILGSLWFLKSLFFSNIIVFILLYIQQTKKLHKSFSLLFSFILLIIGYFIHYHWGQITYDIQRELITPILLIIGIYIKQYISKISHNILLAILAFLLILFSSKYFTFDIAGSVIYNPIIYIIFSIIGFYLIYMLSTKIQNIKFLAYIGDKSLSILLLHQIAFYTLQITNTGTLQYNKLNNNYYWIIYSLYAIFFSLLLNFIYNKIKNRYEKNNYISSIR